MSVCVVGVGNRFRGDDAVGLEVARLVRAAVPWASVVECEGEPIALLEEWAGFERAIVVDAMTSGAAAGTVRRIDVRCEEIPPELRRPSTHLLGVGEAVELARALDRLPPTVIVYAIEGAAFEAGSGLTAPVAAAAAEAAAAIRRELES